MKLSRMKLGITLGLLGLIIINVGIAYAIDYNDYNGSISALSSGYAITRWPTGSGDVFVGTNVSVRAVTTNLTATHVRFRWIRPNGSIAKNVVLPLNDEGNNYDGALVIEAWDWFIIDAPDIGETSWGVQAIFLYSGTNPRGPTNEPFIKIKAISYHAAIPEVPYGVITSLVIMFGALGIFRKFSN